MPRTRNPLPSLPKLLDRKLYKTGQTRGADDDDILQNRVLRNSTALFPYRVWNPATCMPPEGSFERGYIVLISPGEWRDVTTGAHPIVDGNLTLGQNLLLFYQTRQELDLLPPESNGWTVASRRYCPPRELAAGELALRGHYVARIAGTTASGSGKILLGFTETKNKGAGIQGFEYASASRIGDCRLQLEAFVWMCPDALDVLVEKGMARTHAVQRRDTVLDFAKGKGLLDVARLTDLRVMNSSQQTICPLCRNPLSVSGFLSRLEQAEGREVLDLTVTALNLFHIEEVRYGAFNHRPYNLGWGCHHCNTTTRDMGLRKTLHWMQAILGANSDLLVSE
jgi:hypothetical protein